MSNLRARSASHLRGLIAQGRQSNLGIQRSQGFRDLPVHRRSPASESKDPSRFMSNMSTQRSQGPRDMPVHRQRDKKWRPPPATNENMAGMQMIDQSGRGIRSNIASRPSMYYGATRPTPYEYNAYSGRQSGSQVRNGVRSDGSGVGQTASGGGSGYHPFSGGMFLSYHDLELALERRGLSVLRFLLGVAGTVAVGVGLMWPRIKRWGAAEGAEVAAASLQQQELKEHATALVNALIAEPKTTKNVEEVMKGVMRSVLQDEEMKHELTKYFAQVMSEAMMWPGVIAKGNEYVQSVLANEESIENARTYVTTVAQQTANDDTVLNAVSNVSCHIFTIPGPHSPCF